MKRLPYEVQCDACDHRWTAAYLPMDRRAFVRIAKNLHCPMCGAGARKIFPLTLAKVRAGSMQTG